MVVAGTKIAQHLQAKIPPSEIVNSVWARVFDPSRSGTYEFENSKAFWKLLVTVALNRIRDRSRRKDNQQTAIGDFEIAVDGDARREALEDTDEVEVVYVRLSESLNATEKAVLNLWRQGKAQSEMATTIGVSDRQIRRHMRRIELKARRLFDGDSDTEPRP